MRRERAGADERSRGAETKRGAQDATRRDKRGANALAPHQRLASERSHCQS